MDGRDSSTRKRSNETQMISQLDDVGEIVKQLWQSQVPSGRERMRRSMERRDLMISDWEDS